MGTKNPKVSGYVPPVLKERLTEFCAENDGMSESAALSVILAEFFQESIPVKQEVSFARVSPEDFEHLLGRVKILEENHDVKILLNRLSFLEEKLKSLEPSEAHKSEVDISTPEQLELLGIPEVDHSSNASTPEPLGETQLAKRLQVTRDTLRGRRRMLERGKFSQEDFWQWLKERDPDSLAWERRKLEGEKSALYHPVVERGAPL